MFHATNITPSRSLKDFATNISVPRDVELSAWFSQLDGEFIRVRRAEAEAAWAASVKITPANQERLKQSQREK